MRLSQSLIVASKDLAIIRRRRNLLYSTFIIPYIVSLAFPLLIQSFVQGGASISALSFILPAFSFFYLILAGLIPSAIASYSIIGEKVEKSLEPLLATPTTDGEILFGKGVAAILPSLAAIMSACVIFMGLTDAFTRNYFFPNLYSALDFFIVVPLGIVMSVEWSVLVSSRVSDVRIAQQIGSLLILPFAGLYVAGELGIIQLSDTGTLLGISGALALVDLFLFYVARALFRREQILTKWK